MQQHCIKWRCYFQWIHEIIRPLLATALTLDILVILWNPLVKQGFHEFPESFTDFSKSLDTQSYCNIYTKLVNQCLCKHKLVIHLKIVHLLRKYFIIIWPSHIDCGLCFNSKLTLWYLSWPHCGLCSWTSRYPQVSNVATFEMCDTCSNFIPKRLTETSNKKAISTKDIGLHTS